MAENFFDRFDDPSPKETNFFDRFDDPDPSPKDKQSSSYDPTENEGVFQEFFEGVGSGLTKIPQGILELGATGIDLVAGTETADAVTGGFESFREAAGLDPVGIVGKGAEIITQFGVPGGAAFKAVGALSKAGKLPKALQGTSKAKELAIAAGASGAADVVFATNDTGSLLEGYFDGETGPESEEGLSNRGQALENLKDRLFIGAEGAVAVPAVAGLFKLGKPVVSGVADAGKKLVQSDTAQSVGKAVADSTLGKPVLEGARGAAQKGAQGFLDLKQRGAAKVQALDDKVMGINQPIGATPANMLQRATSATLAGLRPRGRKPQEIAESKFRNDASIQAKLGRGRAYVKKLDESVNEVLSQVPKPQRKELHLAYNNLIHDYLIATPKELNGIYKQLPAGISREAMNNMRGSLLRATDEVKKSNFFKESYLNKEGVNVKKLILDSITGEGGYLRRDYEIFRNKQYKPTALARAGAKTFFKNNRKAAENEISAAYSRSIPENDGLFTDEVLRKLGGVGEKSSQGSPIRFRFVDKKVSDEAADAATDAFLNKYRRTSDRAVHGGRIADTRVNTDMFLGKKNIPPALREAMGEIKNPSQAYEQTLLDLASFTAADKFYGDIATLAKNNEGIGKLFEDTRNLTPQQIDGLRSRGYVKLGDMSEGRSTLQGEFVDEGGQAFNLSSGQFGKKASSDPSAKPIVPGNTGLAAKDIDAAGWGSLEGYMVPKQIYSEMTAKAYGNIASDAVVSGLLSLGMKGKGVSQYGKTVLSPVTQFRNFTSASLFAVMNGNVGRGANVLESVQEVLQAARGQGDEAFLKEIEYLETAGLFGNSSQLREIKDLLAGTRTGFKGYNKEPGFFEQGPTIKGTRVSPQNFMRAMEKLYQSSDDVWKLYSFKFEQNKLKGALQKMSVADQYKWLTDGKGFNTKPSRKVLDDLIRERSAQIVRDTVPNYAKAPKAIKGFRKMPVGNFVTFPYEIYRTGFNTVDQAMKEVASGIPSIQNIGYRRLAGVATVNIGLPTALVAGATALTGIGKDQIDAFQRSFSAPWVKNATLIPGGRDEDGNLQFYNWSTFNPYDQLTRYMNSSVNAYEEAKRTGQSTSTAIAKGAFEAAAEGMQSFSDPAILAGAMFDVVFRDGRTATGAQVYQRGDPQGTKLAKSIAHVMGTLIPTISPIEIRGGKPAPRKFVRSVLGGEPGTEGISSQDKQGNEYGIDFELGKALLGFRPLKFNPENSLRYKGYELKQQQSDAIKLFSSLTDDANVSSNQLVQGYINANNAKKKADEKVYQVFEDGNALGLSDREMKKIFKNERISISNNVIKGFMNPYKVSSQQKDKMRRNDTYDRFPKEEIRNLYRSYKGTPLTDDPIPTPIKRTAPINSPAPSGNFFDQFDNVSAPAAPSGNFFSQFDTAPVAPPVNRTNVSSTLLGDPKNADIINRQP